MNLKYLLIIITLHIFDIGLCSLSFAQNNKADSLLAICNSLSDNSKKSDILNEASWQYRFNDIDKALNIGKEALQLSQKLQYEDGQINAFINIAYIYIYKENFDRAMDNFNKAMKIIDKIVIVKKQKVNLAKIYEGLGLINYRKGNLESSIESYQKASQIYTELTYNSNNYKCFEIISKIYQKAGNKQKSALFNTKVSRNKKKTNNTKEIPSSINDFNNLLSLNN